MGFPRWLSGKKSACQGKSPRRHGFGKIPWRRKWKPSLVFLPGKSHGWRSLEGYSPWGRRVGHDRTELACMQPGTEPQPTAGLRQSSVDIQPSLGFGQIRTKLSTPDLCLQTLKPATPLNISRCISPVSSGSSTAQSWRCFLFSVPRW